jgi:hypothetical protein
MIAARRALMAASQHPRRMSLPLDQNLCWSPNFGMDALVHGPRSNVAQGIKMALQTRERRKLKSVVAIHKDVR